MKKYIVITALALAISSNAFAEQPAFSIAPIGRVLMDGALYASPQKENWKDGVGLSEVRLGAVMKYGDWTGKVELGYANGNIGGRDIYLQYNFAPASFVRAGQFIHPYGLQAPISSSLKCTFEEPASNTAFASAYLIGVMGQHATNDYYGAVSLYVEPKASTLTPNQLNHEGYGAMARQVWRPMHEDGKVVQVGITGGFASPQTSGEGKPHDSFTFSANFPTKVDKVPAVDATLHDCMNQFRFSPELLINYDRFALESQYYYNQVNMRKNLHSFAGQGAYVTLRGLLLGDKYHYASGDACLALPKPGSLEMTLCYNYTALNDTKAQFLDDKGKEKDGIFGGRLNTFGATLNYYANKYVIFRLNYTYCHSFGASSLPSTTLNIFQARAQILF